MAREQAGIKKNKNKEKMGWKPQENKFIYKIPSSLFQHSQLYRTSTTSIRGQIPEQKNLDICL